jgi:antitoxin CptB
LEAAVTTRSSEGLDARRRRLLFRAWHRGIREVDLVLGRFADRELADLSAADLDDFERLLDVPTPDLLAWVMGERPVPPEDETSVLRRMLNFHLEPKAAE